MTFFSFNFKFLNPELAPIIDTYFTLLSLSGISFNVGHLCTDLINNPLCTCTCTLWWPSKFFHLEFIDFYCYFYNNYTLYLYTFNLLISTGSLGSIFSVYTLALSPSFKLNWMDF